MSPVAPLFNGMRQHGAALACASPEPAAELLALVWGSRFDREHAQSLIERLPHARPETLRGLMQAADSFDGLPHPRQQRIRSLLAQQLRQAASEDDAKVGAKVGATMAA